MAVGAQVNFAALGRGFVLPLLLSPLLAVATGALIYAVLRGFRLAFGIRKEMCLCVGIEQRVIPMPQPSGLFAAQALPAVTLTADEERACIQRYAGTMLGFNAGRLLDGLHFLSAGAVSFARGLNDAPKIAALLLVASAFDIRSAIVSVTVAMAIGGVLNARKVAETMSHKITDMNRGQGFAANLSTALLVTTASYHGLPVSTTHLSVGSLVGLGTITRQVKWKPVSGVLLSWVITLPCAAALAAVSYLLLGIVR